jgi:hypothetical protein
MASLSTVYFISIIMASLAGIGSAFVGNAIHEIKGGADYVPPTPAEVANATAEAERATNEADKKAKELRDAESFQTAPLSRPSNNLPTVAVRTPEEKKAKELDEPFQNLPTVAVRTQEEKDAKELEEAVNQLKTDS